MATSQLPDLLRFLAEKNSTKLHGTKHQATNQHQLFASHDIVVFRFVVKRMELRPSTCRTPPFRRLRGTRKPPRASLPNSAQVATRRATLQGGHGGGFSVKDGPMNHPVTPEDTEKDPNMCAVLDFLWHGMCIGVAIHQRKRRSRFSGTNVYSLVLRRWESNGV